MPYVKNTDLFTCPSDKTNGLVLNDPYWQPPGNSERCGYGLGCHIYGYGVGAIFLPAETILLADTTSYMVRAAGQSWGSETPGGRRVTYRHNTLANFAFCDGHVKAMKEDAAEVTGLSEDGVALDQTSTDCRLWNNRWIFFNNCGRR
jgi:prepilin-type processing-associated H-X9-DG protein